MHVDEVLTCFPGAKRSGAGWTVRCPAHDDGTPSLTISTGNDGRTLLKCHAGCLLKTSSPASVSRCGTSSWTPRLHP